jgi:hypothetical protein
MGVIPPQIKPPAEAGGNLMGVIPPQTKPPAEAGGNLMDVVAGFLKKSRNLGKLTKHIK